jgi:oxalate---CoA ligase
MAINGVSSSSLTLTGLLKKAAASFPDKRALSVAGKFEVSHSRLQELIDYSASVLRSAGVHPGDVVALTFPNSIEVRI